MGSIYTFKYYLDIHVESMESIEGIVIDSTWIPEEYSMEYPNSMILSYGMNMEKNFKMARLSAKNIPYGIHRIHMELAWIPPGMWGHSKNLPYKSET